MDCSTGMQANIHEIHPWLSDRPAFMQAGPLRHSRTRPVLQQGSAKQAEHYTRNWTCHPNLEQQENWSPVY